MKIAVIHNLVEGGARRRLAEQVTALDAEVVEFTTSQAVPVTARPYVVPLRLVAQRLPAVLRPPQRVLDVRRLRSVWAELGTMAERSGADVIFANPDSVLRGAVPLGTRAVPIIRYCDEPRRIDYEPALRASLNPRTRALYAGLRRLERRTDRAGIAEASLLATNSRYTAAGIQRAYGRNAEVLPCGAPERMTPDGSHPRHLLSVGSLIPSKGHDLAITAAARCGLGLPLVVVAYRDVPSERDRLTRLAAQHGVDLRIRTAVGDDELISLYRAAYATLYLAAAEPLGLVSLEAQACGSPVVVSGEGGLPETVADGVGGFVVSRDADAAAAALARIAEDRPALSRAAASSVTEHSWKLSAARLVALATDLAARNPVRAIA
ncbi:glycosyltransferase [Actinoplanes sp. NBC_00393]|uniref:glycosyltransferase family 4 protein n=1 Tax=Actinoplanes sp. NBC_00393 TaxID=2975953 RepID=UPI002E1A0E8B